MDNKVVALAKFLASIYGGGWERLPERARNNYLKDAQKVVDFLEEANK